ncbi:hypothetical protein BDR07DRAFT_1376049 [Suillus spraguei]|nr:hypothetical protein BDR07DRAFT_1376049 [Suillus spraguei]
MSPLVAHLLEAIQIRSSGQFPAIQFSRFCREALSPEVVANIVKGVNDVEGKFNAVRFDLIHPLAKLLLLDKRDRGWGFEVISTFEWPGREQRQHSRDPSFQQDCNSTLSLTKMFVLQIQARKLPSPASTTSLNHPLVYLIDVANEVFFVEDYATLGLCARHSVLAAVRHGGRQ